MVVCVMMGCRVLGGRDVVGGTWCGGRLLGGDFAIDVVYIDVVVSDIVVVVCIGVGGEEVERFPEEDITLDPNQVCVGLGIVHCYPDCWERSDGEW